MMSPNQPRQHHIVPAFYLAGFTEANDVDGRLHVFDYWTAKRYLTTPSQACRERDYYRMFADGFDPFVVEATFSRLESELAPTLREVIACGTITRKGMLSDLLYLAAFIHARSRRARMRLSQAMAQSLHRALREGTVGSERWQNIRDSEVLAGVDADDIPSYETAVQLAASGEWRPPCPRVIQVGMLPEVHQWIYSGLIHRAWDIMITDPDNGGFVTSDSALVWGMLDDPAASLNDQELEVTFPVGRAIALVNWRGAKGRRREATDEVVAHVNTRTVFNSTGQVFHALDNFMIMHGRPGNSYVDLASKYFEHVERGRRAGIALP
jgi:hypothetical protein